MKVSTNRGDSLEQDLLFKSINITLVEKGASDKSVNKFFSFIALVDIKIPPPGQYYSIQDT